MDTIAIQVFLLLAGIGGWALSSIPMLRYMIDLSEKRFRWPLIGWMILIVVSIYLIKFSLYSLVHWPAPGTLGSKLFFGFVLILSYAVPFVWEWIRSILNKK